MLQLEQEGVRVQGDLWSVWGLPGAHYCTVSQYWMLASTGCPSVPEMKNCDHWCHGWRMANRDDDCDHWCHGWCLWQGTDVWHLGCSLVNYIGNIDSQYRLPHVLFHQNQCIALTPLVRHISPRKQWYSRMSQWKKYKTLELFIIKLSWQTDMHVHAT